MIDLEKLIQQITHDLFITVPNNIWKNLYHQLLEYCAATSTNRKNALIVTINCYQITITNINHHLVVKIPDKLEYLSDVNFTKEFKRLPIEKQIKIKEIIKNTIKEATESRKKA